MRLNETKRWAAHHVNQTKQWVAGNARHFRPWMTKKVAPVLIKSAVSGGVNGLCAKLFTSVPPVGISILVANATLVNHAANALFKYERDQFLNGEPKAVCHFVARTLTVIYVPRALTSQLGYEVDPSDCLKVGLTMIALMGATLVGGLLILSALPKGNKLEPRSNNC